MSKEERTRLVSTDSVTGGAPKAAEEGHRGPGDTQPSSKRASKDMSRDKDEEHSDATSGSATKRKRSCPMYFGVKSYLHHFYDTHTSYKDPSLYEDDDDTYLLHPNPRRRRCPPIWWKIFMWVGVNLLLFGVVGILVGYLVPPKTEIVGENKPAGEWYIDTSAKSYNTTLDTCKLIGLVLFCIGGITLAMALLFPSFFSHYCDDELDDIVKVPLRSGDDSEAGVKAPLSPIEMTIPASSKVKSVQPTRKTAESAVSQVGAVVYKD